MFSPACFNGTPIITGVKDNGDYCGDKECINKGFEYQYSQDDEQSRKNQQEFITYCITHGLYILLSEDKSIHLDIPAYAIIRYKSQKHNDFFADPLNK